MHLPSRLSFQGRFVRKQFWGNWLLALLLLVLAIFLGGLLAPAGRIGEILGVIISLVGVAGAVWLSLATQVKRWHDLNHSGWRVLLNFIPFVGFLICLVNLGFIKGKPGPNRYDPSDSAAPSAAPPSPPVAKPAESPAVKAPRGKQGAPGRPRRLLVVALGFIALVLAGGAVAFLLVPGSNWTTRRSWMRATLGSPAECQAMAWRYRAGNGLPQDFAKAAQWFQRAADKGLAPAQYDLAVLHFYGIGVPADPDAARPLLESAAGQGYIPALTLLGLVEENRLSGSVATLSYWDQAAQAGDPWAQSLLGSRALARRDQGDGKENLILALYWLETARRNGVETVGGLLQHVWATVPAEDLETVTGQVFGRLAKGKPDPLPPEATAPAAEAAPTTDAVAPPESATPAAENTNGSETTPPAVPAVEPASTAETSPPTEGEKTAPDSASLSDEVLAKVRSLPEYVSVSTLYAEKSQADPAWPASEEGQAVGQYLQRMRNDAQATALKKTDDGKVTLEYSVGGNAQSYAVVRTEELESNSEYRQHMVEAMARNIVDAPRSLKVAEFLRQAAQGEASPK